MGQVLLGRLGQVLLGVLGQQFHELLGLDGSSEEQLRLREMTYGWNLEMQAQAARLGFRVTELPVDCRNRLGGSSKVAGSLRGSLRAASRIVATFVRVAAAGGRNAR